MSPDTILEIARQTGLRQHLHGVNATDAREMLGRFAEALFARAEAGAEPDARDEDEYDYEQCFPEHEVEAMKLADAAPVADGDTFAEWLATEMPSGTIIGNPAWWANRIARQYRVRSGDAVDAARWRALIGSARIRVLGSVGLHSDTDPNGRPFNGYAHIGLELWTRHDGGHSPSDAADWLTRYVDTARNQGDGRG